jgi:thioredoxin 2
MDHQAVPVELGDHDFHDFVKQAPLPVLVDFFSPTCGPCRMMGPVIDEMARENANKYIVAKVDTSTQQRIALFFNIRAVPTLMFFKDGALVEQISGAVSKTVLEQKLKSL